jgi:mono/diheme cytochrome c family protein
MTARSLNTLAPAIIAFTLIFSGTIAPVRAQEIGNLAEGQRIAAESCNGCHQSDLRTHDFAKDPIPSFRAIAAMPSTTMLAINVFLRTSHNVMPNIQLSETEIADVGAYILSLGDQPPK